MDQIHLDRTSGGTWCVSQIPRFLSDRDRQQLPPYATTRGVSQDTAVNYAQSLEQAFLNVSQRTDQLFISHPKKAAQTPTSPQDFTPTAWGRCPPPQP